MWKTTRLTERLSLRLPIVLGPFGGASTVALTAAVSEEGGLGSYGANGHAPAKIAEVVGQIRALTSRPFAINLWVPSPDDREPVGAEQLARHVERLGPYLAEMGLPEPGPPGSFAQDLDAQVAAAVDAGAPVVSFVFGVPPASVLERARAKGVFTIGNATSVDEAVALERAGLDAVVASGSDAGGHRGAFLRPVEEGLVGTLSLVPQVVDAVKVPVIAAGGIGDGRGIIAALSLGAEAAQIGTTFLATHEAGVSEAHKAALRGPMARETRLTRAFSGRYARGIENRFMREMRPHEGELRYPLQNWLTQPIRREAGARGQADLLSLWAGQAAALSRPRSAKECVRALEAEAEAVASRLGSR